MDGDGCAVSLFLMVLTVLAMGFAQNRGFNSGQDDVRKKAVEAGVAYYLGDPQTGKSTFTWKTPTK